MAKLGQTELAILVIGVVAVAYILSGAGAGTGTGTGATTSSGLCTVTTGQTLSLASVKLASEATTLSPTYTAYSGTKTLTVTSSKVTVNPSDTVVIFANTASYYNATSGNVVVTCKSSDSVTLKQPLVGALTLTIVNNDGLTKNGATLTTNESFSAGQGKTQTLKIQETTAKGYWSHPDLGYMVIGFKYNQTYFQKVQVVGADSTSVPRHMVLYQEAYKVNSALSEFQEKDLTLQLQANSGVTPSGAGTNGNVTVAVADAGYFQNTVTGLVDSGVEDDKGNDIGATDTTATDYIG